MRIAIGEFGNETNSFAKGVSDFEKLAPKGWIKAEEIIDICKKLGFDVSEENGEICIEVPNRRLDITIKPDVIEEIARLHGYDKLNETLPKMDLSGSLTPCILGISYVQ